MNAVLRLIAWTLALALLLLPVMAVVNGWVGAERWPLRTLRVVGDLQRVDEQALRDTLYPYAERGYFAVPLADAQAAIARLPWVERVQVRKQWPDVLVVEIDEHRPFAWWGSDRLLSEKRTLFSSLGVKVPPGLPRFDGPHTRSGEIVDLYNRARGLFAATGVDVRAVRLDERGSWSMALSDGTELLIGRDDARLRLARFARLLPQLRTQSRAVLSRADLRYTNGFALTWGERGLEVGDSGLEKATTSATATVFRHPAAPGSVEHVLSNHESPITNPGSPL
jgi:cell division protein FtsQ